jgi:hypothetical protein
MEAIAIKTIRSRLLFSMITSENIFDLVKSCSAGGVTFGFFSSIADINYPMFPCKNGRSHNFIHAKRNTFRLFIICHQKFFDLLKN